MPELEKTEQVPSSELATINRQTLREHLYLIEQAAVGKMTVVPSTELAYHYPADQTSRTAILQCLLDGTQDPTQVASQLQPDGLTYDAREVGSTDLTTIMGKVRDATAKAVYYDYERFAQFMANMHGAGIDVATVEAIYDRVIQSRIRKISIDTYGPTGRQQIAEAIQAETASTCQNLPNLPSGERIFEALKQNWAANDLLAISITDEEKIVSQLNPPERELFERLKMPYRQFIQTGTSESFSQLTTAIKSALEIPQEENQKTQEQTTEKTEGSSQQSEQDQQGENQQGQQEKEDKQEKKTRDEGLY